MTSPRTTKPSSLPVLSFAARRSSASVPRRCIGRRRCFTVHREAHLTASGSAPLNCRRPRSRMNQRRCSFCFRPEPHGVAGARVFICASCVTRAVEMLGTSESRDEPAVHPATEEFLARFAAFREQLQTDHPSAESHRVYESSLDVLETSLRAVRELLLRSRG
jgi:hypothetical protein